MAIAIPTNDQHENGRSNSVNRMIGPVDKLRFLVSLAPDQRLNATDLRCAIVITDLHNAEKGRAWPSWAYLVKATGCSRTSVWRSVKKLHELGAIKKDRGGRGRSNSYYPSFLKSVAPPHPKKDAGDTRGSGEGAEIAPKTEGTVSPGRPQQSHTRDQPSLTGETQSYYYPAEQAAKQGSNRGSPSSGGAPPVGPRPAGGAPGGDTSAFDEWFAAYPKQEGRAVARKEYDAALARGVTHATLLAGARHYAIAKQHLTDQQYIKMPANWLREECWLEDPKPPRPRERHGANAERRTTKTRKTKKTTPRVSSSVADGKETASERPHRLHVIEVDKFNAEAVRLKRMPSLGTASHPRYGVVEILKMSEEQTGPIWFRIGGSRKIEWASRGALTVRTVDDIARDVSDGTIQSDVALAEQNGIATLNGWAREAVQLRFDRARHTFDSERHASTLENVPASSPLVPGIADGELG